MNDLDKELFFAIRHDNVEETKAWLLKGANVNAISTEHMDDDYIFKGYSPLIVATEKNNLSIMALLLEHGANVNYTCGPAALHAAVQIAEEPAVKLLLEHGADVNLPDGCGSTPLLELCRYYGFGNPILKLLIEAGAEVNLSDNKGLTPLMALIEASDFDDEPDDVESVKLLLAKGADMTVKNSKGETLLEVAENLELSETLALLKAHDERRTLMGQINPDQKTEELPVFL